MAFLFALCLGAQTAFAESITTTFEANNGYAGNMFDVTVTAPDQVVIDGFDIHVTESGEEALISVYIRSGSYVGAESSTEGWTLVGTQTVTSAGEGNPTPLNIGNITLASGQQYGFYVTVTDYDEEVGMEYTDGNNVYSDGNLTITTGVGKGEPDFTGSTFEPRTWNGTIYYHINISIVRGEGNNRIREMEKAFWGPVCELIAAAEPDSVLEIDLGEFARMPGYVMDALRTHPNVGLVLKHNNGWVVTIPAGEAQPESNISFYSLAWLRELYA